MQVSYTNNLSQVWTTHTIEGDDMKATKVQCQKVKVLMSAEDAKILYKLVYEGIAGHPNTNSPNFQHIKIDKVFPNEVSASIRAACNRLHVALSEVVK